jgi:hypothetical protein
VDETDITHALIRRYSGWRGNGVRYVCAAGVRSHAGFDARRTADFMVMDMWPSKGLKLQGFEIKTARSDWLRELKHPEKAAEFIPYVNQWWLVIPDLVPPVARTAELPADWGMMVVLESGEVRVAHQAPRLDAKPLTRTRTAALLRAAVRTAAGTYL